VVECINKGGAADDLDTKAIQQSLTSLNDTLDTDNSRSSLPQGITPLQDSGNCSYIKVSACLQEKITFLMYVKLVTIKERNSFCKSFSENAMSKCFSKNLESCPSDKKAWYTRVNARIDKAIDDLRMCEAPQTCILSEGFACVNKLGTEISQYDRSKDKVAVCIAQDRAKSCIDSFTYTCSSGETSQVMSAYNVSF
ncbi:hypothetical protein ElyMa_004436100, partial [Elysia marginata]